MAFLAASHLELDSAALAPAVRRIPTTQFPATRFRQPHLRDCDCRQSNARAPLDVIPSSSASPPGTTFARNDYRCDLIFLFVRLHNTHTAGPSSGTMSMTYTIIPTLGPLNHISLNPWWILSRDGSIRENPKCVFACATPPTTTFWQPSLTTIPQSTRNKFSSKSLVGRDAPVLVLLLRFVRWGRMSLSHKSRMFKPYSILSRPAKRKERSCTRGIREARYCKGLK